MDDSISKLLIMATGLLLCLAALGSALHLQDVTNAYLNQMKKAQQTSSFIRQQATGEYATFEGFELVAAIAHQLRQKDVQLDNADLAFENDSRGNISYKVKGIDIDVWSKLSLIDQTEQYRIIYKITGDGAIEEVICEGIN